MRREEAAMRDMGARAAAALSRIRAEKPLVHHITNLVVTNDAANVTLCVGALPVMAHATEEVAEVTRLAAALVFNLGTLSPDRVEAMLIAGRAANEVGVPVVLDPVGAGAITTRTRASLRFLDELTIAVVRGNAGEIGALSGVGGAMKGVESVEDLEDPAAVAQALAQKWGTIVAVTGKRDVVSDGQRVLAVDNGHRWLTTLTGTGCMATSVIAAFTAVEQEHLVATAGGLACFGLAAERAAPNAHGPASFKVALFDQLHSLTPRELAERGRILELRSRPEGG